MAVLSDMPFLRRWAIAAGIWLCLGISGLGQGSPSATVRSMAILPGSDDHVQLEITTSQPLTPLTQVVTGPDRLIIDFPNALPGRDLQSLPIRRGELKGVRVGLFSKNPPVTRIVLDLERLQPFQVSPSGNTVIVKLNPGTQAAAPTLPLAIPAPPPPRVDVEYRNGKLKIVAERASLAAVLYEVHRRTGAEISIPPAAGQEKVFATLGPAPARDVITALLRGSRFNFVMVGADGDPNQLRSLYLTPREGGMPTMPAVSEPAPTAAITPEAEPSPDDIGGAPEIPPEVSGAEEAAPEAAPDADATGAPSGQPDMVPRRRHQGPGEAPPPAEEPQPPEQ